MKSRKQKRKSRGIQQYMLLKRNSRDVKRYLLPAVVVLLVGLTGGVYFLLSTHAATISTTTDSTADADYDFKVLPPLPGVQSNVVSAASTVTPDAPRGCYLVKDVGCYYWVHATDLEHGTGAAVDMSINNPTVGANDSHSIAEIWISDRAGSNAVEFGWMKTSITSNPELFAYHWVNGNGTCYNRCGFVPAPGASVKLGQALTPGTKATFKVNYNPDTKRWNYYFNNVWVGYFPERIWNGKFTSTHHVAVWGEVSGSTTSPPETQMGNGKDGTLPGSAYFRDYRLIGGSSIGALSGFKSTSPYYSYGITGAHGFHYGGTP